MTIQSNLLHWYSENKRDLPFRKTKNPYYIWISEIMLQQTQVKTVIPYFERFIEAFPTVEILANAQLEEVYKYWEGLGYYRRAKHLHLSAKQIMDEFNGSFPNQYVDLLKLKGVGDYTASAISSIAFGNAKGVIDGNTLRILSRIYMLDDNIATIHSKKKFQKLIDDLILKEDPSSFNQAMMDLGAMICKPKGPECEKCPILEDCKAYQYKKQNVLPINIKKKSNKEIHYLTCIIEYENRIFLIKNESGLLEGIYGFPQTDVESLYQFTTWFNETYHESISIHESLGEIKHVFSHRVWKMHVYYATFNHAPKLTLYSREEVEKIPISTAHKKVLKLF